MSNTQAQMTGSELLAKSVDASSAAKAFVRDGNPEFAGLMAKIAYDYAIDADHAAYAEKGEREYARQSVWFAQFEVRS